MYLLSYLNMFKTVQTVKRCVKIIWGLSITIMWPTNKPCSKIAKQFNYFNFVYRISCELFTYTFANFPVVERKKMRLKCMLLTDIFKHTTDGSDGGIFCTASNIGWWSWCVKIKLETLFLDQIYWSRSQSVVDRR